MPKQTMKEFEPIEWLIEKLRLHESLAGEYIHITMSVIALLIIIVVSIHIWQKLKTAEDRLLPDEKPTVTNIFELMLDVVTNLMGDIIGPHYRQHIPLLGSVFFYILICNLLAIVPGMRPPTENINTNLACAAVVFVYFNYIGIKNNGLKGYLKHMAGPIIWIAPLLFSIELISYIVRPISLSVRLFGNIMGDHMVLGIFSDLIPLFVPVIFMIMTIFIAFIQAFVFTLLSMIYISLASGEKPAE